MRKKATTKKKLYIMEYEKENCTRFTFRLNNQTDADIIEHLKTVGSKNAYLKDLIRKDMNTSK